MSEEVYKLNDENTVILKHGVDLSYKEIVIELNRLNYYRLKYRKGRDEWEDIARLCFDVIDGYKSYNELKRRGYYE